MCLWLFIAESTFYRGYIQCCPLTCLPWGSIVSRACVLSVWGSVFIPSFIFPPCLLSYESVKAQVTYS